MKDNDEKYTNPDLPSNWSSMLKENGFRVPDGYFDELESITRFRLKQTILTEENFPVPVGYFEGLERDIQTRIAEQSLRAEVSQEGFAVPAGYFEATESAILDRVRPTKVRRLIPYAWARYAAAASLVIAAALFALDRLSAHREMAGFSSIPDEELIDYLKTYSSTRDMMLFSEYIPEVESMDVHEDISSDEIESYLENTL